MSSPDSLHLSAKAFADLKQISQEEYGDMPNGEIRVTGVNLLRLFGLLVPKVPGSKPGIQVTMKEFLAMKHIHYSINHDKKAVTARSIAEALGLRSSKSGWQALNKLIEKCLYDPVNRPQIQVQIALSLTDIVAVVVCDEGGILPALFERIKNHMKFQVLGVVVFNEDSRRPQRGPTSVVTINETFEVSSSSHNVRSEGAKKAKKIVERIHQKFKDEPNYSLYAQFCHVTPWMTARSEICSGKPHVDWMQI